MEKFEFSFYTLHVLSREQFNMALELIPNGIGNYDVGHADMLITFEEQDTMLHVINIFVHEQINFDVVD